MSRTASADAAVSIKKILVLDVGGTHVKVHTAGEKEEQKFVSGPAMTPREMVLGVNKLVSSRSFEGISIGYPGLVLKDRIAVEPVNLGPGWVGFDFAKALGAKVKLINDAAMQALGSYRGGRMLFLGLGTGLGSALIVEGKLAPMELAHLPYRHGRSYEDYVGMRGLLRMGKKKWLKHVFKVIALLRAALEPDEVVLGGGNIHKLGALPEGIRLGSNENALAGGLRLWERAS